MIVDATLTFQALEKVTEEKVRLLMEMEKMEKWVGLD